MSFEITRVDGRSNAQVLIDHVATKPAGTTFTFAELQEQLNEGTDRVYEREDVSGVVSQTNRRLLREHQRRLHSLRGVGYRLAPASEHMVLASGDRRRADKVLRRGMETLRNVRWDEMDDNTRRAHEGQLLVLDAVVSNQDALDRRMARIEEVVIQHRANGQIEGVLQG